MFEHSLFHKLPPKNQAELLEKKGIVLTKRHLNGWAITLFSLENQFLEVWSKKDLEIIGSFHSAVSYMDIIEPYINVLDVPEES